MLVVVCPGCGHLNDSLKRIPRDAKFHCRQCDSRQGRVHRRYKVWLVDLRERAPPQEQAIADTWGGLLTIAEMKSYKPGWAKHKFRAIYAFWPDGLMRRLVAPYVELQDWVEKEKNKWKAQRKREEKERWEAVRSNGQHCEVVASASQPPTWRPYTSGLMDADDWNVDLR
jgi:hypothetical protein